MLTATYYAGERLGMILALSLGFVLGVYSKEALFLCGAFGFSTLVAGLFSSASIFGTAGAFGVNHFLFNCHRRRSGVVAVP